MPVDYLIRVFMFIIAVEVLITALALFVIIIAKNSSKRKAQINAERRALQSWINAKKAEPVDKETPFSYFLRE